jgi:hypothetical protein
MRMGKSLVEDDTKSAVLTELGREYRGMNENLTRGLKYDDVRNRMEKWKESVESAQRITS